MKRVLMDYRGVITDVADVGKEFEIYDGDDAPFRWVLCRHDDVTSAWHFCQGQWIRPDQRLEIDQDMKRKVAYGLIEDQLGMLYKDIKAGHLTDGAWVAHVDNVKANIPPQRDVENDDTYKEGKYQVILHGKNDPAWNNLPDDDGKQLKFNKEKDNRPE